MSDENPYAPPTVAEPEASSTLTWQVQGPALLVKNGAILPRIDLETGEHDQEMRCVRRVLQTAGFMVILRIAFLSGLFVFLSRFFKLDVATTAGIVVVFSLVVNQLIALRGPTKNRIIISEFSAAHRVKQRLSRRIWRVTAIVVIGIVITLTPFLISRLNPDFTGIVATTFGVGVVIIVALVVWAALDQSSVKTLAGPPGWMRIAPVHPQALHFLRDLENATRLQVTPAPCKRLVRTTYLHRYPLKILLGTKTTKPRPLIRITLMKLLRSRHLVRESYHYNEALTVPADQLCQQIRYAIDSWLATHPDWSFVSGEQLPSPAGDLHVHLATLASPGVEHCVYISCTWATREPDRATAQFSFGTWLRDDLMISTYDCANLPLLNPRVIQYRTSGTPDQVFQVHLQHCAGQDLNPPQDMKELFIRIQREREETDQLLTAMGLQSEVREVG